MIVSGRYPLQDSDVEKHGFINIRESDEIKMYRRNILSVTHEIIYNKQLYSVSITRRKDNKEIECMVDSMILLDQIDIDLILTRISLFQNDLEQFREYGDRF